MSLGVDAFEGQPVDASLGDIVQLVVTDLDGDGDDEALVVFEHVQADSIRGAPGDLSSVLLVDADDARFLDRAEVRSSTKVSGPMKFRLIERFRIVDVADYNGDGTMEIAVHAWYYEGASVHRLRVRRHIADRGAVDRLRRMTGRRGATVTRCRCSGGAARLVGHIRTVCVGGGVEQRR